MCVCVCVCVSLLTKNVPIIIPIRKWYGMVW